MLTEACLVRRYWHAHVIAAQPALVSDAASRPRDRAHFGNRLWLECSHDLASAQVKRTALGRASGTTLASIDGKAEPTVIG